MAAAEHEAVTRFVRYWAAAVQRSGFCPMSPAELETMLSDHTECLIVALLGVDPDDSAGHIVGAGLVRAGLTDPDVVRATLTALGEPFRSMLAALGVTVPAGRTEQTQATLAAAFAATLRKRTLVEQERLGRAVLQAQKDTERALWESEARFRALFRDAAIGIGIADVQGRIVQANPALARLLGYAEDELRTLRVRDLVHPVDDVDMWQLYDELTRGDRDYVRLDQAYRRKDGSAVWTNLTVSLLRDDAGVPRYTVAMIEDVTERHQLQERLRYEATHDMLTGLPNRACFTERLAAAFTGAGPDDQVGLCYLDLDGFKRINDSLGHDVGDRLLVAIAQRLSRCTAEYGHLVARMGGDEFVILAERASQDELTALADRVLASLDRPVHAGTHQFRVSASIGIVAQRARASAPAEILKAADLTLYRAKAAGRGRWACYDADLNAAQVARYTLAEELPDALDRAEFGLLYQPLVTVATGRLHGVEALLRWHHPYLGILSPDVFVDLAEESGAIGPIGRWVLREACGQAADWRRRHPGHELSVSVNLATAQTYDPALVDDVLAILAETGLPADALQLELTESAMMTATGTPVAALRTLAGHGIRIAIDDFGTGYSNLVYLRTLPVKVLKLARQFIEGLKGGGSETDAHIVATLIRLAHVLELTVIAEGVETAEQLARLRALDCDVAQGWHLARPLPAAAIDALIDSGAQVGETG